MAEFQVLVSVSSISQQLISGPKVSSRVHLTGFGILGMQEEDYVSQLQDLIQIRKVIVDNWIEENQVELQDWFSESVFESLHDIQLRINEPIQVKKRKVQDCFAVLDEEKKKTQESFNQRKAGIHQTIETINAIEKEFCNAQIVFENDMNELDQKHQLERENFSTKLKNDIAEFIHHSQRRNSKDMDVMASVKKSLQNLLDF